MFGLWALPARTARADPHAIFYTAIGQQQLFFNVLAALDQADYVETQIDRQGRVDRRATVPTTPRFSAEQQPLIGATNVQPAQGPAAAAQPGISAVLTRLLTLEGNDLYTDELVRSLAAEVGRRNSTDELLRVLCDFALGLKDCEQPSPDLAELLQNPNSVDLWKAQVRDPLEWAALPFWNGVVGAFSSGLPLDAQRRASYTHGLLLDEFGDFKNYVAPRPVAFSKDIDRWRNVDIPGLQNPAGHQELLNQLLTETAEQYLPAEYAYPFAKFAIQNGQLVVARPDGGPVDLNYYLQALQEALTAPEAAAAIAAAAYDRVALQLDALEEQGLLAEYRIVNNGGELTAQIDVPKAARVGTAYSLPIILGQLDTSQQFASPVGVDIPGNVPLVNRPLSGVAGATTEAPPTAGEGEVAGAYSLFGSAPAETLYQRLYRDEKKATSPAVNVVAGHLEEGALHTLDAITNKDFSKKHGVSHPGGGFFR